MKLEEAIEILEYHQEKVGEVAGSSYSNALQLGIEALKTIAKCRDDDTDINMDNLLPGESG